MDKLPSLGVTGGNQLGVGACCIGLLNFLCPMEVSKEHMMGVLGSLHLGTSGCVSSGKISINGCTVVVNSLDGECRCASYVCDGGDEWRANKDSYIARLCGPTSEDERVLSAGTSQAIIGILVPSGIYEKLLKVGQDADEISNGRIDRWEIVQEDSYEGVQRCVPLDELLLTEVLAGNRSGESQAEKARQSKEGGSHDHIMPLLHRTAALMTLTQVPAQEYLKYRVGERCSIRKG